MLDDRGFATGVSHRYEQYRPQPPYRFFGAPQRLERRMAVVDFDEAELFKLQPIHRQGRRPSWVGLRFLQTGHDPGHRGDIANLVGANILTQYPPKNRTRFVCDEV